MSRASHMGVAELVDVHDDFDTSLVHSDGRTMNIAKVKDAQGFGSKVPQVDSAMRTTVIPVRLSSCTHLHRDGDPGRIPQWYEQHRRGLY